VGVKEVDSSIRLVSFMDYVDLEERTLRPLENPFGPKVLPIAYVSGPDSSGIEHHSCRAGSTWTGDESGEAEDPGGGHSVIRRTGSKRSVVHRLQGRLPTRDKRYCYPLTVTDHAARFLLLCEAMESNRTELAFQAFERLFKERGLPRAIRSDNGVPFASPHGLFRLSKLSVWCLRLGITIERIQPGHPQQNGRHERMHLTLKQQATRPEGANILQQQGKFDAFIQEFNNERPHEALDMMITNCGRLCLYRKKINLSKSLAGQAVGVKEVDGGIWLVSFMDYDLGYIDLEERTLQPLENPFGPKVSPMS
jgi:hypothetical protein